MPRRPLPDSEDRKEQGFQRWMARAALALVLLTALLGLVLYLIR